jgi:hypothetical protein
VLSHDQLGPQVSGGQALCTIEGIGRNFLSG